MTAKKGATFIIVLTLLYLIIVTMLSKINKSDLITSVFIIASMILIYYKKKDK